MRQIQLHFTDLLLFHFKHKNLLNTTTTTPCPGGKQNVKLNPLTYLVN
jgi:hypothetical protein